MGPKTQSPGMLYSGDIYEEDLTIGIWKPSSKYTQCFFYYIKSKPKISFIGAMEDVQNFFYRKTDWPTNQRTDQPTDRQTEKTNL